LVGEKGSGKTALAFYIQNTSPDNIKAKVVVVSESQYMRFMKLREKGHFEYSDYTKIWETSLLYIFANEILSNRKIKFIPFGKFHKLAESIKKYKETSLTPEHEVIKEFVTTLTSNSSIGVSLEKLVDTKHAEGETNQIKTTEKRLKSSLYESYELLKDGLIDLKLKNDVVIFFDGLDAKPSDISHEEYKKSLIGLSEAIWNLNSSFFPNIKDTSGQMRGVLLLRPDVFDSLNLHNSNCKLNDNSVLFHWDTTNEAYTSSDLFCLSDKYFRSQNNGKHGWQDYFKGINESFEYFIQNSFQRPRDIFAAIQILIEISIKQQNKKTVFDKRILTDPSFREQFSDYLLGEAKNYANFYFSNSDFEYYVLFFQYLKGKNRFNYQEYIEAFKQFTDDKRVTQISSNKFMESPDTLLQFWHDLNIVGYKEIPRDGSPDFYHWSLRDRKKSKIMPKVKLHADDYLIHPGIAKALNIGKSFG